ncbi:SDR family oxidoreductase [Streptomyces sp. NPDC057199]|uniref:SDR family oxidoreductase n=1 Tax=Streptomyces sp. NPDC057199 TaxID=3346047 RepID=UPI0036287802
MRTNAISPGFTLTETVRGPFPEAQQAPWRERIPLNCPDQPEDIASVIVFPLSEEAEWVTEQVRYVDGGSMFRD